MGNADTIATFTLITGSEHEVRGEILGGRVLIEAADLTSATGWELKPVGLCRAEQCIPTDLNEGLVEVGRVDLAKLASLTDQLVAVDEAARVVVLGPNAVARRAQLEGGVAPDFTLPSLAGDDVSLADFKGEKTLVVAFASWCGCAYDLPAWQELRDELAPPGDVGGFNVVAVAIDEHVEAVEPFAEGLDIPVLIDRDRTFASAYALTNVPTVVWIDEDGVIARPQAVAFGSDQFIDFHHVDSNPHHEALRRWVRDGVVPDPPDTTDGAAWEPSEGEQLAHLEYRLALHLWRAGDEDGAKVHFDRAGELAPLDFTVRRAQLPLLGKDPFLGDEFLELYQEWQDAGGDYYGKATTPAEG